MAKQKVILWLFAVLLAASCAPVKKGKAFDAPFVKQAAYVMHVNDTVYPASQPDFLLQHLANEKTIYLLNKINPPAGSTVNFIIPAAGAKAYPVLILPPDYQLPFSLQNSAGNPDEGSFSFEENTYYFKKNADFQLVTPNKIALEKYLREGENYLLEPDKKNRALKYANAEAPLHWIWFPGNIPGKQYWPLNDRYWFTHLGETYVWDMEIPGQWQYAGVSFSADSIAGLKDVFSAADPVQTDFLRRIPQNVKSFRHFNFSSFPVWDKQWRNFKSASGYTTTKLPERFKSLKAVTQAGDRDEYLILVFGQTPPEHFEKSPVTAKFNDTGIRLNADSLNISQYFYPLLHKQSYPYFILSGETVIMARNTDLLQSLMNIYADELTLDFNQNFKKKITRLPDKIHLLLYSENRLFAARYQEDMFFTVFDAGSSSTPKSSDSKASYQLFTTISPGSLLTTPEWIYNHRSKKYELVWQNGSNEIVWADEKGKIRWKRNVDEAVLGKLHGIDMYRNGKSQVLLATSKGLYVIDVRGAFVKPFPLKMKISSPPGVFDYDHNRKYRIAVPLEKQVVMYDAKGNEVKGFKRQELQSPLMSAPQHLRIKGKDYIILSHTDGQIDILDRRGKIRIPVKQKIPLKTGEWFVYQNKLTALAKDGTLVSIDADGKITKPDNSLKIKNMASGHNTYIATDGKNVYINGKKINIKAGEPGKVFVLNTKNKTYYAVENRLSRKIILIEKSQKAYRISEFPGKKFVSISPDGKKIMTLLRENIVIYQK